MKDEEKITAATKGKEMSRFLFIPVLAISLLLVTATLCVAQETKIKVYMTPG